MAERCTLKVLGTQVTAVCETRQELVATVEALTARLTDIETAARNLLDDADNWRHLNRAVMQLRHVLDVDANQTEGRHVTATTAICMCGTVWTSHQHDIRGTRTVRIPTCPACTGDNDGD